MFPSKHRLLLWWIGCTLGVGSQPPAVQPQTYAVIYRLESGRGQRLVELEMQRASLETLSLPGTEQAFVRVPGPTSSVRCSDSQPLRFVVRNRWPQSWSWNQLDPTGFRLVQLQLEGENRILHLREHTTLRSVVHRGLPLKVTPRGAESLLLEPVQNLTAGEYALYYSEGENPCDLFCFSVESSSSPSP